MTTEEIKAVTKKYNNPKYFQLDPLSVVKRCTDKRDIEILGLLCSWLAYGNRVKIYQACCWVYDVMEGKPYDFIINEKYEKFNDNEKCLYRLYKLKDFHYLCKRLYLLYTSFDNIEDALIEYDKKFAYDYLHLLIYKVFAGIKGVPKNTISCCKRMNLFLRWMGRKDGINDCGIWQTLDESKLLLPLDVHSLNTIRQLGIITRKSNDMKTVIQATEWAKTIFPDDPTKLDFFLFGYSYEQAHPKEFEELKQEEYKATPLDLLLAAIYTNLYLNDCAINLIKEIGYNIDDKDRESRKIYSALKRRINAYQNKLSDIVGKDKAEWYAEFCLNMDNIFETLVDNITQELLIVYERENIEDAKYLSLVETARFMTEYSCKVNVTCTKDLIPITKQATSLRGYRLTELLSIIDNFASWSYRKCKNLDINEEKGIMDNFHILDNAVSNIENTLNCVDKANKFIGE